MDLNNLAIVFSPTILKNNSGDINLEMSDIQKLKRVTEVRDGFGLIIHSEDILDLITWIIDRSTDLKNLRKNIIISLFSCFHNQVII